MKIGILTFHNAYNYGAVLQTYATQELVKSLGHEVEVIDYHNKAIDRFYENLRFHIRTIPKRKFYRIPVYFLEKCFYWKRRKAYQNFIHQYLCLSEKRYNQGGKDVINGYDIILIGSDQLWNKEITNGFDKIYWGDFKTNAYTRKVAWSVCMNQTNISEDEKEYIIEHLNNFEAISVRESSLQSMLSKLTTKEIAHTLDPTLVLPSQNWEHLCHGVKEKNYIAVYAVRKEEDTIRFARKVAEILQKPLVVIRSYAKWYMNSENKECGGPSEFLSYIKHADFVVSTSFHGTVFSLIFKKQFACPALEDNVRIESLLNSVGLKERLISFPEKAESLPSIDYEKVEQAMNALRISSLEFLKNGLSMKK